MVAVAASPGPANEVGKTLPETTSATFDGRPKSPGEEQPLRRMSVARETTCSGEAYDARRAQPPRSLASLFGKSSELARWSLIV
eukprot:3503175-Prymnesium_polylepis.1